MLILIQDISNNKMILYLEKDYCYSSFVNLKLSKNNGDSEKKDLANNKCFTVFLHFLLLETLQRLSNQYKK